MGNCQEQLTSTHFDSVFSVKARPASWGAALYGLAARGKGRLHRPVANNAIPQVFSQALSACLLYLVARQAGWSLWSVSQLAGQADDGALRRRRKYGRIGSLGLLVLLFVDDDGVVVVVVVVVAAAGVVIVGGGDGGGAGVQVRSAGRQTAKVSEPFRHASARRKKATLRWEARGRQGPSTGEDARGWQAPG